MIHQQYPLLLHNTFGMDVKAARFVEYNSVDQLLSFIHKGEITLPYLHLGAGSNLLFTKDYQGTILHSCITGIEIIQESDTEVIVRVGAGHVWDDLVAYCVEQRWYGTENLSIIPGEVGASAVQNIGAYGVEVKDLITTVETINIQGQQLNYPVSSCAYTYRDSIFKRAQMKGVFITHVRFKLSKIEHYTLDYGTIRQEVEKHSSVTLKTLRQVIIDIRDSKLPDPRVMGNAGSFFMNPIVPQAQFDALLKQHPQMPFYVMGEEGVKIPAGWLIDQCGWKGKSLGPAAVHSKQALVLVNLGGATGGDIIALSDAVRASVRQKFGVNIHPEVNIL